MDLGWFVWGSSGVGCAVNQRKLTSREYQPRLYEYSFVRPRVLTLRPKVDPEGADGNIRTCQLACMSINK